MTLEAPQIVYIAITMLGLGVSLAQHGNPKKGKESFTVSLAANSITIGILYWGGFFG